MKFKLTTVSAAIAGALFSNLVIAQSDVQTDETIVITGQSFTDYKVDTSVGAMRTDATLLETPQSVSVIPEIVLEEQLATTLGDALVNDSSVSQGTKKWNREEFTLRGFELSSSTGYLRNGHPQFSHYMQPIETLERIEVLKGPSGLLYGQSEPGGLINMVTKKPTHQPMVNVGTDIDDLGSTRYHIDASGALNESGSLRGRTVMVKQDTESSRTFADGSNQERDRFLGYVVVEGDISDWGLWSAHYERTHDKAQLDSGAWLDSEGNVIGSSDLIRDMSWAFIDNEVENIGADFSYFINHDWTLSTSYNYQEMSRHRFDSLPGTTTDTATDGSYVIKPFDRHDKWKHHTFHVDLNGDFSAFGMEHQTLFGVNGKLSSYSQHRVNANSQTIVPGQGTPSYPDFDANATARRVKTESQYYGVYAHDLMTINDQWQLLAGIRFDKNYEDDLDADGNVETKGVGDASAFSPKFGIIYHPAPNGSIYANYSESFTPLSADVLSDGTLVRFDPEESRQYELGTKWELFDNDLMLTGAIFDIEKSNILIDEFDSNNEQITTQGGKQRHRGAEAGAQGRIGDQWFVMASATYLDAEYTEHDQDLKGKTPTNVPEWSSSVWTRYSVTDYTALNLGMIYQGDRWADTGNTIKMDAYTRFDAGASHQVKSGNVTWDFRFNIENLFDKEYFVGSGGSSVDNNGVLTDVHYGDERRFKFSVNAAF